MVKGFFGYLATGIVGAALVGTAWLYSASGDYGVESITETQEKFDGLPVMAVKMTDGHIFPALKSSDGWEGLPSVRKRLRDLERSLNEKNVPQPELEQKLSEGTSYDANSQSSGKAPELVPVIRPPKNDGWRPVTEEQNGPTLAPPYSN